MPLAPVSPGHQRPFKARPLNRKVMESAGDLGVPRITRAAPTAVKEFKFGTTSTREAPEEVAVPVFSSFTPRTVVRTSSFPTPRTRAPAPAASKPTTTRKEAPEEVEVPVYSSFTSRTVVRTSSFPTPRTRVPAPAASQPAAVKTAAPKAAAKPTVAKPTATRPTTAKPTTTRKEARDEVEVPVYSSFTPRTVVRTSSFPTPRAKVAAPAASKAAAAKPAAAKPAAKPAAAKPAAAKPAAAKPAAAKPAAAKPAAAQPAVAQPAVAQPAAFKPAAAAEPSAVTKRIGIGPLGLAEVESFPLAAGGRLVVATGSVADFKGDCLVSASNRSCLGGADRSATWSRCPSKMPLLVSAPARPLCLLRVRLAALGQLGTPRVRPSH